MDVDAAVLRKHLGLAEDADDAAITEALNTEPTPVEASAPTVPEGMALVDEATLTQLRSGAEQAQAVAARLARQDRDEFISAAIKEGKFPGSRREAYERLWAADEEGARATIASLAPGLVPVNRSEIGGAGDGENAPEATQREHEAFMARHYPNQARSANRGRARVHQEAN